MMTTLYTTTATASAGRNGQVATDDLLVIVEIIKVNISPFTTVALADRVIVVPETAVTKIN